MTCLLQPTPRIAIACGGTGGHLFPGIAVADALLRKGSSVMLLISPKEIDQQAVRQARGMEIVVLPAVGLVQGEWLSFARGFWRSYQASKRKFAVQLPVAALSMGGFTGAAPLMAAKRRGAQVFLHESNAIPGRANRWLSWIVREAFIGFGAAAARLHSRKTVITGTPVRPQIHPRNPAAARAALGLDPSRPVVLVVGGSQGAKAINEMVLQALPVVAASHPHWQWLHLAGTSIPLDVLSKAYQALNLSALVRPFMDEIPVALDAATAAISRAGASSLAELAAMRLPALLVPYPAATDDHQLHNARAFEQSGATRVLLQEKATTAELSRQLAEIMEDAALRGKMQQALGQWHMPAAAEQIAEAILRQAGFPWRSAEPSALAENRPAPAEGGNSRCGQRGTDQRQQDFSARPLIEPIA